MTNLFSKKKIEEINCIPILLASGPRVAMERETLSVSIQALKVVASERTGAVCAEKKVKDGNFVVIGATGTNGVFIVVDNSDDEEASVAALCGAIK